MNQRDLVTFSVDRTRAVRVAASIPDGVIAVAESGVDGPEAATELAAAGFAAILVGEHLVTADRPRRGSRRAEGAPPAGLMGVITLHRSVTAER